MAKFGLVFEFGENMEMMNLTLIRRDDGFVLWSCGCCYELVVLLISICSRV